MSHCCGGCGGDDPLMKKSEVDKTVVKQADKTRSAEKDAKIKTATTGTWQPPE